MIRVMVVVALLAGCGGSATTLSSSPSPSPSTSASGNPVAMCVAFDRIEREIEPALQNTNGEVAGAMAGLTVVVTGSDIVEMAADEEGEVAADLIELGEAFQHQGSVIQATSANPELPAEDPTKGTDLYAVLRAKYDC